MRTGDGGLISGFLCRRVVDEARIEVQRGEFSLVRAHRQAIGDGLLALGFVRVTLDLRGFRSGSLLGKDRAHVELLAERR